MTSSRLLTFALIWLAVGLYAFDAGWRASKSRIFEKIPQNLRDAGPGT